MNTLTVILGNQLFDYKYFKKLSDKIFMCEDYDLCTHYKYHKHKIIHFLASMRDYRDYLKSKGKEVYYQQLDKRCKFSSQLRSYIEDNDIEVVQVYEIEDKFFEQELIELLNDLEVRIEVKRSPMFLCSREEFTDYLDPDSKPLLNNFYKQQRKKFSILLTKNNEPRGGKWNYDQENRKKIPKKYDVENFIPKTLRSKNIDDVKELINKYFSDHPGESSNYWIPTNRKDAIDWFKSYLSERFEHFGEFQDAIDERAPFLYHSVISPFLNIGFITPREVIREVEKKVHNKNLNDVEGFIRQVLGWREFVRGIYQSYSEKEESENFFDHQRKLTHHWYEGTTGIEPLDYSIKKAKEWGYCHHIERLMVIGNLMLMLQIHPREVHRWFMEMFVDSSDWVMVPNVYGMSQFSDGGIFATKPYFSGSNYILKMSNYKKSNWCDGVDGLFWQFVENNKGFLKNNYRMAMMVKTLEKMDSNKKSRIFKAANEFRDKLTC